MSPRPSLRSRSIPLSLLTAATLAGLAVPVATASAKRPARVGGEVRAAWPARGTKAPKTVLARWLARQVGPVKASRAGARAAASASGPRASVAATTVAAPAETIRLERARRIRSLQLIRSFDIPRDDPSYKQLANWSWTYDSAVAATAFSSVGLQKQAGRLLDQLAALQRKDGAIEFAFDVRSGESSAQVRTGSVAWSGIAFLDYGSQFGDDAYLGSARLAADYLLTLRGEDGLLRGGPDVEWVSTQHNLAAYLLFTTLSERLAKQDPEAAARYREDAERIAKGVEAQLTVRDQGPLHLKQGVGDEIVPLDAQTLGIVYALLRGDSDTAKQLYTFVQENFQLADRSIELSSDPATFNQTYAAKGPFSGYLPYVGKGVPDVLWFEGTAEMRLASTLLGQPTDALDASMKAWWAVTEGAGLAPLGADRTVTDNPVNQYHVWPTAAAGAWTLLSGAPSSGGWADPEREGGVRQGPEPVERRAKAKALRPAPAR